MSGASGAFIVHVGRWCGKILTELSVTDAELIGDSEGAAQFLKQFVALTDLELEVRALEMHQSRYEPFLDEDRPPMPSIMPAVFTSDSIGPYTLYDVLPSSLERFRLISFRPEREDDFVRRLVGEKNDWNAELPKLERLELTSASTDSSQHCG